MTDISASADNIEMLRSVRDRLFDAFRDGDCPVRELSALARRLQEVGSRSTTTPRRRGRNTSPTSAIYRRTWRPR
jgi:hypothetical protein